VSNTVQLPALTLTVSGLAPTLHAAEGNRIDLPALRLNALGLEPTIVAGQQKLRYSGVGMGIKTKLGNSVE
jgi:hypothetical protein